MFWAEADKLIKSITELEDEDFDPHVVTPLLRGGSLTIEQTYIVCDVIDSLWDEVVRLRCVLDQSKGENQ